MLGLFGKCTYPMGMVVRILPAHWTKGMERSKHSEFTVKLPVLEGR